MFLSSMTNVMTQCMAPNGSQIYRDSAGQDMKKITSETTLSPSERGDTTISDSPEKALAVNQKAFKGPYGDEGPF